MADRSNWPSRLPDISASSRQEPDESLYPSRIARKKIGPSIPVALFGEVKHFCFVEGVDLQDLVTRGLELAMAEIRAAKVGTGYPVTQSPSHPLIDQKPISDEKMIEDINPQIEDHRSVPLVTQLGPQLIETLQGKLSAQSIETWFKPLRIESDGLTTVIRAPSPMVESYISANYRDVFREAMTAIGASEWRWELPAPAEEPSTDSQVETMLGGLQETPEMRAERWLNFYAVVTGNRVWPNDRDYMTKVLDCSDAAIEGGILRSKLKVAGGRMRGFNYCLKAIFQINASGVAAQMLREIKHEWQQALPGFESKVLPMKGRR